MPKVSVAVVTLRNLLERQRDVKHLLWSIEETKERKITVWLSALGKSHQLKKRDPNESLLGEVASKLLDLKHYETYQLKPKSGKKK